MQLIPNAGQWYKMYSQRGLAVIATLSSILIGLPDATKTHPIYGDLTVQTLILSLTILTSVITGFLRLVQQFLPDKE